MLVDRERIYFLSNVLCVSSAMSSVYATNFVGPITEPCLSSLFICPSDVQLSVCSSVHPFVQLVICLSICPSLCPVIRLSICSSVCPTVQLCVSLYIQLSICLSIYPSVLLSVCLSIGPSVFQLFVFLSICPSDV